MVHTNNSIKKAPIALAELGCSFDVKFLEIVEFAFRGSARTNSIALLSDSDNIIENEVVSIFKYIPASNYS